MPQFDEPISVVMPVRNALPYLDQAVRSILAQSHRNFEFVIGDDGSTDGSRERLREWARRDSRIRLIESEHCLGPAGSSNWVAGEAAFALVARMDADDISRPHRLARQIEVLRANPDAVLVGSLFDSIDARGALTRRGDPSALLRDGAIPIAHASIMYRRDAFRRIGGYRDHCCFFEDVDLYHRIAREGRILVVAEPLIDYRFSSTSARLCCQEPRVHNAMDFYFRCLSGQIGADDVFPRQAARPIGARVLPQSVKVVGVIRLWSGHRPAILGTMLRRARLGWNLATLGTFVWAIWGSASPASLRAFLRARTRWRSAAASRVIEHGGVYGWEPERGKAGTRPAEDRIKEAPEPARAH